MVKHKLQGMGIALLAFLSIQVQGSPLPDFPFVTVSGTAERGIQPDQATLNFTVFAYHEAAPEGEAELHRVTRKVLDILETNGIAAGAIRSYEIERSVRRNRDESYNSTGILGYEFRRNFTVDIHSIAKYSDIAKALFATENLSFNGTHFDYSKRAEVELELTTEAAVKAKEKAQQMALGLDVTLGDVFAFNDSGSFTNFFATFGLGGSGAGGYERMVVTRSRLADSGQPPLFIPQSIDISKTVNVIYRVNP